MKISTLSYGVILTFLLSFSSLFAQGNLPYTVNQTGTFNFSFVPGDTVILGDESISSALPIGFSFDFFDSTYTSFYIGSNGFITFTNTFNTGCCDGQQIPDTDQPNNLIAFAWNDLDPGSGGTVMYSTDGIAPNRKLLVTFLNVPHFGSMITPVTVQVVLYEGTNYIEIHSATMNGLSGDHTMGLENIGGTIGVPVPGRNASNWNVFTDFVQFRPVERLPNDAGVSSINLPNFCAGSQTVAAVVKNFGSNQINPVTVNWEVNGVLQTPVNYTTTIDTAGGMGADSASVSLGSLNLVQGQTYNIRAWTTNPNMVADTLNFNDTTTLSFASGLPSGTYTIGGSNPDYLTWQDAVSDLNNFGICGAVIFNVRSGTYSESLELTEIAGASATNTVTFQSESGDSTDVILSYTSAGLINQTLLLNGASYVTFQHLTIRNNGTSFQANAVAVENGASYNTFRNNVLEGPVLNFSVPQLAVVYSSPGSGREDNANNNVYQQNRVLNGAYGFYLQGYSVLPGDREMGNQVLDNQIVEPYNGGIFISDQDTVQVIGNEVDITGGSGFGDGLALTFCYDDIEVSHNQLRLNNGKGIRLFALNGGFSDPLSIYNNFISLTGANATEGIEVSTCNFLNLHFNNVHLSAGGTSSSALKIDGSSQDIDIKNNIFANSGDGYAINDGNSTGINFDFNDYFVTTSPLAVRGANLNNLQDWQMATGQDSNSFQVDPLFTSVTDLHVNKGLLNASGMTISGITTDIDGDMRGTPPDIGADEFTPPPSFDATMANIFYPQAPFAAGSYPVSAVIRNGGTNTLTALTINWSVNDTLQGTIPWGGSLATGQADTINLGMLNLLDGRVYEIEARVDLPLGLTNADPSDDTLRIKGIQTALLGIYTIGGTSPDFSNFTAAVDALAGGGVLGPVTFLVRDGVYEEQIRITEFAGSTCQNPVIFRSQSADSSKVTLQHASTDFNKNYVLQLDGADGLTFQSMTLRTRDTLFFGNHRIVDIQGGASCNTFDDIHFWGVTATSSSDSRALVFADDGNLLDTINTFQNSLFERGSIGIELGGLGFFDEEKGNIIRNNTFLDQYFRGLSIFYQEDVLIENNHISSLNSFSNSFTGIYLFVAKGASVIEKNTIEAPTGTGVYLGSSDGNVSPKARFVNNFVSVGGSSGGDGIWMSNSDNWDLLSNSVHVYATNASSSRALYQSTSINDLRLINNVLANSGGGYAVYLSGLSYADIANYNDLYSSGSNLGFSGVNIVDLATWRLATNQDSNSISANPLFISNTDLHIQGSALDGVATSLASVTDDIDGDSRDATNPDIGADEFDFLPDDIGILAILSPQTGCSLGQADSVTVRIANFGSITKTGFDVAFVFDGQTPVVENVGSLSLAGGQTFDYTFKTATLNLSGFTSYDLISYTSLAGDLNASNDTSSTSISNFPAFSVNITGDNTACSGESILLEASTGGSRYVWSGGGSGRFNSYSAITTTTYSVTATNLNGCTAIDSFQVVVTQSPPKPTISANGPLNVCNGDTVILTSSIGGNIQWSTGDTSISITVNASGSYHVTNLDNNNICSTASDPVNVNISKDSISTSGLTTICQGNSITLTATGANTATWSNGSTSNTINVSPAVTTSYWVNATTFGGCMYSDTVTVTVNTSSIPTAINNAFPTDGSINLAQPVRLSWQPGVNTLYYDVFLWKKGDPKPFFPTSSNQTNIDYLATGLDNLTSYYWQVVAKNACQEAFSDTLEFKTIGLPDLVIDTFSVPQNAIGGQGINISWTVTNQGVEGTGGRTWFDYVWLSSDENLSISEDISLGTFQNVGFLNAGQSYTQTQTITIPISLSGSYYFFISTDNPDAFCNTPGQQCFPGAPRASSVNNMPEEDETNNWVLDTLLINPAPVPDLQINTVGAPTAAFSGDDITVTYQVENKGVVQALGPWRDEIYLSTDSIFDPNNVILISSRSFTGGQLAVDSTYTYMAIGQIPYSLMGTYWVHVLTDQEDDVYEGAFDGNNDGTALTALQITLTPPPDLDITAFAVSPNSLNAGQQITVDWTVTNQGFNPSPISSWEDQVYISLLDTFNIDSAIYLGKVYFTRGDTLMNGDSYSRSQTYNLPNGLTGNYYVYVFTDGDEQVFEFTAEANNIERTPTPISVILPPYPDLIVSQIQVAVDTMLGGTTYNVTWQINNQGTGPATGGWTDRLYLSPFNNTTTAFASLVGDFAYPTTLAAGDSAQISVNIVAPNLNGLLFFLVETDFGDVHYEYLFEHNNKSVISDFGSLGTLFIATPNGGPASLTDLYANLFTAPDTISNGNTFLASGTGQNLGPASIPAFQILWEDAIYLSTDTIWDASDTQLAKTAVYTQLDSGDTYSTRFAEQMPYGFTGNYYLLYVVDYQSKATGDTLRANNVFAKPVFINQVFPPDLVISQFAPVDTLYAGQQINFPYEVTNQGMGAIRNGDRWADLLFFGNAPSLNSVVQSLGLKTHIGPLGAGASYRDTIDGSVPLYLSGNYYLILNTNYTGQTIEDSLQNNFLIYPVVVLPSNAFTGDLAISDLQVPDSVLLGFEDTIRFELKNVGTQTLVGNPRQAFYYSTDNVFDGALDPLFNLENRGLRLAPGDSLSAELIGISKEVNAGDYQGILRSNISGSLPEATLANNDSIKGPIHIDAKALTLGLPDTTDMNLSDFVYYKVDVGAGLDLLVTLTSNQPSGINEVWVAYNRVPITTDFDFKNLNAIGTNQQVLVPNTMAGTYYILAQTQTAFASNQEVEILAEALPFSILSISPDRVGQGEVSTSLAGAGFQPGVSIELRDSMGTNVANANIKSYINSMQLELKWDLSQVPLGVYDVVAINPNLDEVSLEDGLTVEEALELEMAVYSTSPNVIRQGRQAVFNYVFQNVGNLDVPYAKAEIGFLKASDLVSLTVAGDVYKLTDLIDTSVLASDDWIELNIYKFIPLLGRDLAPGEQFFANVTFENFVYSDFPIRARVLSYTTALFAEEQARTIENQRQYILNNTDSLQAFPNLLALANDPYAFRDSVFQVFFDEGIMDSMELAGIPLDTCTSCDNNYNFSPGFSPGTQTLNDTIMGPGGAYLWEINHPYGMPGQDPGWDLLRINGRLDITATAQDPFVILMSSLSSYTNLPDFLTTWAPGYDFCWPIAVASGGIYGFDTMKVKLDTSLFVSWNATYGGIFYLEQQGTDSLFIKFQATIPGIGQTGIPGGPGQPGQPGAPGGPGGAGDGTTPPGMGGPGGTGGVGIPADLAWDGMEVLPAMGGEGGEGGMAGTGQDGGAGGTGGEGGQGGPSQTGGPGGPGGEGGEGSPGNDGGPGGPGGDGGGGDTGGPGGTPGPGGPGDGGGSSGPGGSPGNGGKSGGGYGPEGPPAPNPPNTPNTPTPPNGPNPGPGSPGLGPVDCNTQTTKNKSCEKFWQAVGCGTTYIGCGKDLIKYAGAGAVAGAGWGAIAGVVYAGLKCGVGIFNCTTGGNDFSNGVGCATGIIDVALGDPSGALGCGGYLCESIPVVKSCDPNEIVGPPGYETDQWVSVNDQLDYTIFYENDPDFATAPAQRVTIRQEIDPEANPATFSLGEIGFNNMTFQIPPNRSTYSTVLNVSDSIGVDVEVTAGLDFVNNEIFWIFQSIDPGTGLPPYDPLGGYLPINDSTGQGEGFVKYFISPKSSSVTGDTISATASIVFDINDPLITNTYTNLIDAFAPASTLDSIPAIVDSAYTISVDANDDTGGVGAAAFDIYASENGGAYTLYASGIPIDSSFVFEGNAGSTYCLFSRAIDWVKNQEPIKTQPDGCFVYQLPGEITLLQPAGGESYCTGDTLTVIWSSDEVDFVNLYYSADSGQSYVDIELGRMATDSVFQWILPDSLNGSDTYFFKVESEAYPSLFAQNELPFTINQRPAAPVLTGPAQTMYCAGDTVSLEGPLGYAAYHWSNGDTSRVIKVTSSGSYSLTVENEDGCESLESNAIALTFNALPAQPVISTIGTTTFCQGDSVGLAGPQGFVQYLWSNGLTTDTISVQTASSISLQVVDGNGCTSPASAAVSTTVNALPAQPSISGNLAFCQGDSTQLRTASGFSAYSWSNGSTDSVITVNSAQTLSVFVTDANGCVSPVSNAVNVMVNALPAQPSISANGATAFCEGDDVQLSGPSGFVTYNWSNGATGSTIIVDSAASVTLSVIDANGCESPVSATITTTVNALPAQPAITAITDTSFCDGDSAQLAGPLGFVQYIWSNGAAGDTISVSTSNSITLQIVDANGCTSMASASVTTTANPLPAQPTITPVGSTTFCQPGLVVLNLPPNFAGYNWSNTSINGSSIIVNLSATITGSVIDANGCESPVSAPIVVTANPLPPQPVISASGPTTFCEGDNVVLSGPAGFSTYNWSNGATGSSFTVDSALTVTLSVVDTNGCESPISTATQVVVNALPAQPMVMANGPLTFCEGDSVQLSGPAGFASYAWSNGDTMQSTLIKISSNLQLGVTDTNGCESPLSVMTAVQVNALPMPAIIPGDTTLCDGESLTLRTLQPYASYAWSDGSSADSLVVSMAGTYAVSVIDANMCEGEAADSVTITVLAVPAKPAIMKVGTDSLMATVSGTSYQWFVDGTLLAQNTQSILTAQNGRYTVIVFNGPCQSSESDSLLINTGLDDLLDGAPVIIYPNPNSGIFEIRADFKGNTFVDVQLFTADGKLIHKNYVHAEQGRLREKVFLPNLAAGMYLLRLRVNDDYVLKKLEVVR